MKTIDWLPKPSGLTTCDEPIYLDSDLKEFTIVPLVKGAILVMKLGTEEDGFWHKFAVMDFYSEEYKTKITDYTCLFHGEGPSGSLRECRHTYWGERGDGYIFYPNGKVIADAFVKLSAFYDEMV